MNANRLTSYFFANFLILLIACNSNHKKDAKIFQEEFTEKPQSSHSLQFQQVRNYIIQNGSHERLNASAIAGDTSLMIDYFTLLMHSWSITTDHTHRIYFAFNDTAYGNMLLNHKELEVEPNYLGTATKIDTLNDIIMPIEALYEELLMACSAHTHHE